MDNPLLALDVQPANTDISAPLARGQEMRTAKLSNVLQMYQLQQAQRADARNNALANLYAQHGAGLAQGNPDDINALAQVDPVGAQGFQKSAMEQQSAHIDLLNKKADFIGPRAQAILNAPEGARPMLYERMLQEAKANPDIGVNPNAPPQYDENAVRGMVANAQSVKDQLAQQNTVAAQGLTAAGQAEAARHNRVSEGQAGATEGEKVREFNASNPMLSAGAGGGALDLSKTPPATQATVKAMLEGRMAPPSSFALSKPYWQNMMALANSTDPTFDQTSWGARASARKDMMGGGKSYQTLNSGNTAIQHLGRLHDQIGDVSGVQVPFVGNMVNSAVNAGAQASGLPGVNAYNDTLGHLAEETTKFYRSTGGSEADVERNMGNLAPNLSAAQKSSGVQNTVDLIYGKLQPMVEQYNKTMGTNFPPSHFLSQKSVATLKKMGFDPDTGERAGDAAAPGASAPSSGASSVIHYDAQGNRVTQ